MNDLVDRLRNYPYEACKLAADRIEELEADIKEAMRWDWSNEKFDAWPEQMQKLADKYWREQE